MLPETGLILQRSVWNAVACRSTVKGQCVVRLPLAVLVNSSGKTHAHHKEQCLCSVNILTCSLSVNKVIHLLSTGLYRWEERRKAKGMLLNPDRRVRWLLALLGLPSFGETFVKIPDADRFWDLRKMIFMSFFRCKQLLTCFLMGFISWKSGIETKEVELQY